MQANHKLDGLRQCMCLRTQFQVIRAGLEDLNYPSLGYWPNTYIYDHWALCTYTAEQ